MLSKQVIESLGDAKGHIRNALAYAARNERTVTVNAIAVSYTHLRAHET